MTQETVKKPVPSGWRFYVVRNQRGQREYFITTYNKRSYDDKFFKARTLFNLELAKDDERTLGELKAAFERGDFSKSNRSNISESDQGSDKGIASGDPGSERTDAGTGEVT